MKKITSSLFIIFLLLLFGKAGMGSLVAQYNYTTSWPSRFQIGLEGGVGRNTLFGNPILEKMDVAALGFSTGICVQYDFNEVQPPDSTTKSTIHFGFKTGIYYERKGASSTPESLIAAGYPAGNTTIRYRFDYITVPFLVKFMMGRTNRVKLYQILGPYFSVLANQSTVYQKPDSNSISYNRTTDYQKFDVGLVLGFGIEIPIQQQYYFGIELRQNLGLYNIATSTTGSNGFMQTNATNLLFSFSYRFKKNKPPKIRVEK